MNQSRYQIVQQSFSMALDEGWQDQSNYRFVGPEFDGLCHYINLAVDNVDTDLTVQDYAVVYLQTMQSTLHAFNVLKQGELTLFDNNVAYWIVEQWQPEGDKKIILRCVFALKKQKMHILSTSFTLRSWAKLYQSIDNMMRSFH